MGMMVKEVYDALRSAGATEEMASAAAQAIPSPRDFATKADLAKLRTELKTDLANVSADIYRQLWFMAAGLVTLTVTLVKVIP